MRSEHWWMGHRKLDALFRAIAWRLPHRIVTWCGYRILANATAGDYGNQHPSLLKGMDAMERWYTGRGGDRRYGRSYYLLHPDEALRDTRK